MTTEPNKQQETMTKIDGDELWNVAWTYIRSVVDTLREPFARRHFAQKHFF